MGPPSFLRRLLDGWRRIAAVILLLAIAGAAISAMRKGPGAPPLKPEQVEAGIPERWRPLIGSVRTWQAATSAERKAFLVWALDVGLEIQRAKASQVIQAQQQARLGRASETTTQLFLGLIAISLLVLLSPFFISRERVPRRLALWGHTILATGTLVVSLLLLLGCVLLLVSATGLATSTANPEQGLLDAGFAELRADIHAQLAAEDAAAPESEMPYGPMVGAGESTTAGGYIRNILSSLQYFDPESFKPAIVWTQRTWQVVSHIPLIVPFVVVLVVLLTMRTTLLQVLRMPRQAAQGEKGTGRRALGRALRFVGLELFAVLTLIGVLLPAGLLTSLAVRYLSRSVITVVLAQTETTVVYFGQLGSPPDQESLAFGMLAVPVFLALATCMSAGGLALFALRSRRLLQQRFHYGWPLRRDEKLWRRSFMAMLKLQWIPALVMAVMAPQLVALHAGAPADAAAALERLTAAGTRLGFALPVAFILFGGLGALRTLWPFARLKPAERGAYTLRPRTPEDGEFLRRAHHEGLRPWVEATWGWDEVTQAGFIKTWLEVGTPAIVLVGGEPAGYLETSTHETAVELTNVVLLPAFQGRGIGTRIVQDVIEQATAQRLPVRLQVLRANPARALYERLGFRTLEESDLRVKMLRPLPSAGAAAPGTLASPLQDPED